MKYFLSLTIGLLLSLTAFGQSQKVPDKVQYQSLRFGAGFNSSYDGYNGMLSQLSIGYYIDQAKTWGVAPFFNGDVYLLTAREESNRRIAPSLGIEPGLLMGWQNNKVGIKLLTAVHLLYNSRDTFAGKNPLLTIPVIGINVGTGFTPRKHKMVYSAYIGVSPFQGGTPGIVVGFNIGYRLRPITYERVP